MAASCFYADHSRWSDPGSWRASVASWGKNLPDVATAVDALLRHPRGASKDVPFTDEQRRDLLLRSTADLLGVAARRSVGLDAADPARKVGGVCRDFALLAVSALRELAIPARLRVGFADYLTPGFHEDHWVCEWHDGTRWRLFDVEVAARSERGEMVPGFDPTDVPRGRFLAAVEAWYRAADGSPPADLFGVSALGLGGRWFVAASLLRDEAAVMKVELKPWDVWGAGAGAREAAESELSGSEVFRSAAGRLRAVARSSSPIQPSRFAGWVVPDRVVSYPLGEPLVVQP